MKKILLICISGILLAACSKSSLDKPEESVTPPKKDTVYVNLPKDSCNNYFYSVNTCPGELCSSEINVSWGVRLNTEYCIVYLMDETGKILKQTKLPASKAEKCTVYDGIYSKKANGDNFYEDAKFLKYRYTLTPLSSDKKYTYRITSHWTDSQGRKVSATSDTYSFKTAGADSWTACIISDFHSYPPLPGRLSSAMKMVETVNSYAKGKNGKGFDWVLHLGDVVAWGGSWSFWNIMYREKPFKNWMWAGLNGNHDNMTRQNAYSNKFFKYATANPLNGYEGEEGVCYSFTYGNTLFVMLNNEDMGTSAGLQKAQAWVRQTLSRSSAKFKVVCEHYQWFYGGSGSTSQYSRWKDLFDECGVDLALGANNHIYVRSHKLYGGNVVESGKGTVYLQTPSSDNDRGEDLIGELQYNQDLIAYRWNEGPKTIGALLMEVNPNQITVTLLDRNGQALDNDTISK